MSKPNLLRRKLCGAVIDTYIGCGGPPLHAPLPMEDRCVLQHGHSTPCTPKRTRPLPDIKAPFNRSRR